MAGVPRGVETQNTDKLSESLEGGNPRVHSTGQSRTLHTSAHTLEVATLFHHDGDSLSEEATKTRRQWVLGNINVCFDAWCAMIGSSKSTILKMVHYTLDGRRAEVRLNLSGVQRRLCS